MDNRPAKIIISLLCLALLLLGTLSYWLYALYESPEELALKARVSQLTEDLECANEAILGLSSDMRLMQEQNEADIALLEQKISILIENGVASDAYTAILLDEIQKLKTEAQSDSNRIKELDTLLSTFERFAADNFGYDSEKITDLLLLMTEPNRPTRTVYTEHINEETGEIVDVTLDEKIGKVAFYYKDLITGHTIGYNDNEIMYAASLIKVSYIYSIFYSIVGFENNKLYFDSEGNPLYGEDGTPLFEGKHPNLDEEGRIIYLPGEEKYDLSRVWTFEKEAMMVEGSGILRDAEDGLELTYLELIEYALLYSDNIAFAQLRKTFGFEDYYRVASIMGIQGYKKGYMQLTAEDCGKFLFEIYSFIQDNERYGTVMKEAMLHSNYPVMITPAVSPTPVAHKYGWDVDAYHDAAIVYDEHPYILVILTDYDTGGDKVNSYIHKITRLINEIHKTYYKNKEPA